MNKTINWVFNIIIFIINIPFWIPLSGYVWAGIIIFNYKLFPWWLLILLFFWTLVCEKAVPETEQNIKRDMAADGFTNSIAISVIILKLLQYPNFIAAVYALKKIT